MNIKKLISKNRLKIASLSIAFVILGIILTFSNLKDFSKTTQTNESIIQKEEDKQKEIVSKFIDNLNNKNIDDCIKLLDDSHIDVNYKLDDGQTLYNKVLNIALEKSTEPINFASDYLPLLYKMRTTADKNLIKLYTDDLNSFQSNFLGCLSIDNPNKKKDVTVSNQDPTKSTKQTENSTKPKTQNFTMNSLELLEYSSSKDGYYIVGKIKNNNSFNCSYVEVKAKITNNNGDVLDTPIANITSLKSGETWSFKIPVIVDTTSPYKYQIVNMKCNP